MSSHSEFSNLDRVSSGRKRAPEFLLRFHSEIFRVMSCHAIRLIPPLNGVRVRFARGMSCAEIKKRTSLAIRVRAVPRAHKRKTKV